VTIARSNARANIVEQLNIFEATENSIDRPAEFGKRVFDLFVLIPRRRSSKI
jgi:hypothetical protein